ncbi:MAG: tyrosine-type recombinase/integrase [Chloroflexi bacterium]|nr:tyrosine-type recombinase/integrase [Chloroflexota bacterium]
MFCTRTGTPFRGDDVTHQFKETLAKGGLPPMRFHDLRHGSAGLMAALGVPAGGAQAVLGHADIQTTMNVYTHVAVDPQRAALDKVGEWLFGNTP